jgi:hypothetical protein
MTSDQVTIQNMKSLLKAALLSLSAFALFTAPAFAQVSLRGLYIPTTQTNPQIIFWVHSNDTIGVRVFASAQSAIGFGKARINNDSFSITTTTGQTVTGTLSGLAPDTKPLITGTLTAGGTATAFTAPRVPVFRSGTGGGENPIAGRFDGEARDQASPATSRITFIIDVNNKVYFFASTAAGGLTGGIGTAIEQDQTVSDGGDEASNNPVTVPGGTFSVTLVDGFTVTGTFITSDFAMKGTFQVGNASFKFVARSSAGAFHLANISTRGFVNTGQGQLIGGFIIRGGAKQVLIRAIGPGLASQGVSGVLAAPKLQIFQGTTEIASNTGWKNNANKNDIIATTIPPSNDADSALLVTLEPGLYTSVVSGADGGTGIALVEGFEVGLY